MALRPVRSALALAVGFSVAAGFFWALLNVPESNVMALALSAALVVLTAVAAGLGISLAVADAQRLPLRAGLSRAVSALPAFGVGLVAFAFLWWLTGRADTWWRVHTGEVDAVFLRYVGTSRTAFLHWAVFSLIWFVRWGMGISLVVALVAAGTAHGARGIGAGLRRAARPLQLVVATIAALAVAQGLWRLVYWRPAGLPATQTEVVFATLKLGVLLALAALLGAVVVAVYSREDRFG